MTDPVLEHLMRYLERRDAQRAETVNAVLARLTDRERRLVTEAAVMGYVQGAQGRGSQSVPGNATIVVHVIEGCLANADLYPTITATEPDDTGN